MTRRARLGILIAAALIFLATFGACVYVRGHGFDARAQPGALETAIATRLRSAAIPREAREKKNPLEQTEETFRDGLAHFADHCAVCHGNDGSGDTDFGRGLYPKPPDLRGDATQKLTDGELFYIIERGVPLTGMPGFGTGTPEGEAGSWHLVQFIRRLPKLTAEELEHMAELNPISAEAWLQRMEEQEFLRGGADAPAPPRRPATGHSGHRH
jgi:mono/diheme cytochrome c family protein